VPGESGFGNRGSFWTGGLGKIMFGLLWDNFADVVCVFLKNSIRTMRSRTHFYHDLRLSRTAAGDEYLYAAVSESG
jgi:hypothetical protein